VESVFSFSLIFSALILFGWFLFSLAAGIIVYHSSMSTTPAAFETKSILEAEKKTVVYSHTKDPRLMDIVNEGRARWETYREEGLFDELSLVTHDGLSLSGYYWPAGRNPGLNRSSGPNRFSSYPERTVVLLHALMDSASGMNYLAEAYHQLGWNVFSPDMRSHGESEGKYRTLGIRESGDLACWVRLLVERYTLTTIFIHGVSMGAATGLFYGAGKKNLHEAVKGIISDSSYSDYREALIKVVESMVKYRFLARSIVFGANLTSICHTGVRFGRMSPEKITHTIPVPILLFHGQKDVLIPVGMARKLFSRAVKPSDEMVVVPEAPHVGAFFYARDFYMQKIMDFVRRST